MEKYGEVQEDLKLEINRARNTAASNLNKAVRKNKRRNREAFKNLSKD